MGESALAERAGLPAPWEVVEAENRVREEGGAAASQSSSDHMMVMTGSPASPEPMATTG